MASVPPPIVPDTRLQARLFTFGWSLCNLRSKGLLLDPHVRVLPGILLFFPVLGNLFTLRIPNGADLMAVIPGYLLFQVFTDPVPTEAQKAADLAGVQKPELFVQFPRPPLFP